MNFQENCPERYWQKGTPCLRPGYPVEYNPADGPGWMCAITSGGCAETPEDCPLWEECHKGIWKSDGVYWNSFTGVFWEKEEKRAKEAIDTTGTKMEIICLTTGFYACGMNMLIPCDTYRSAYEVCEEYNKKGGLK